jgi:hypothetical protein
MGQTSQIAALMTDRQRVQGMKVRRAIEHGTELTAVICRRMGDDADMIFLAKYRYRDWLTLVARTRRHCALTPALDGPAPVEVDLGAPSGFHSAEVPPLSSMAAIPTLEEKDAKRPLRDKRAAALSEDRVNAAAYRSTICRLRALGRPSPARPRGGRMTRRLLRRSIE